MYLKECPKHKFVFMCEVERPDNRIKNGILKVRVCNVCVMMARLEVRSLLTLKGRSKEKV